MSRIKDVISGILKRVPGVIGVILIDIDGIPIEIAGKFDMKAEDLGALLAACYNSYAQVGLELGQNLDSIIVEYSDLKLCQSSMPRGLLTIIAGKDSYLGMIRLEAKRAIDTITQIMEDTREIRKELMEESKFRWPDDKTIDDILSKFKQELK
ncbi:MAG: roadblock/LC7 domain-containing protein [Candidatus Aminicenantes bacterium]|nr:roadblock/LC7 domain-containing protein [Candidatus Aminicenantes bacterium]